MLRNKFKPASIAIVAASLLVGCSISSASPSASSVNEFDVLKTYMASNNMDMNKVMDRKTWIPHAAILAENISDYFVIDIRQGDIAPKNGVEDFKDGHIPGAHHTNFKEILDYAKKNNAGDNILVVSHSGQSAAAAAVALRLSGYPNTKVLKFGMAGWNNKFNNWSDKQSNFVVKNKNWTKKPAAKPKANGKAPVLHTGKTTGAEILKVQVDAFLAQGYKGMTAQELMKDPSKYYVVNQGSAKAYGKFGHVKGAKQFNWPMINANKKHIGLENYPADKEIVQYCWTGHAATTVSSWMDILGYNAQGVMYGTNAMFIDEMEKKKFSKPMNLPYVTK